MRDRKITNEPENGWEITDFAVAICGDMMIVHGLKKKPVTICM